MAEPYRESFSAVKAVFGSVLLLCGLAVVGWIILIVYELLLGQSSIILLRQFDIRQPAEALIGNVTDNTLSLPQEVYLVIGYIIIIILLALVARIGKVLINTGASLLHSDLRIVARKLREELLALRDD